MQENTDHNDVFIVSEKNLQLDSFVFFDYLFSRAYCFWCERKSCVSFVLICFSYSMFTKRGTESLSELLRLR